MENTEIKGKMYTEDRDVVRNHLMQSAKRLMSAKIEGSATMAMNCLKMAEFLDTVETEPKPPAKPRKK